MTVTTPAGAGPQGRLDGLGAVALGSGRRRVVFSERSLPAATTTVVETIAICRRPWARPAWVAWFLVLITAQPDDRGVLTRQRSGRTWWWSGSPAWLLMALTMVVMQTAADAGVSAIRLLGSGRLGTALAASGDWGGWVAVTIFAAVLAVFSRDRTLGMAMCR